MNNKEVKLLNWFAIVLAVVYVLFLASECHGQVIVTEDFTGNTYDDELWNAGVHVGVSGEQLISTGSGITLTRTFFTETISSTNSSFEVRANFSHGESAGVFFGLSNEIDDSNPNDGIFFSAGGSYYEVTVRQGNVSVFSESNFPNLPTVSIDVLMTITYNRTTGDISWKLDGNEIFAYNIDFGSTQFYAGVWGTGTGSCTWDNLYVDYCPDEYLQPPSVTITSPLQGALYYISDISITWDYINPSEISSTCELVQDEQTVFVIEDNENPIDTVFNEEEAELNNFNMGVGSHTITITMYHYEIIPDGVGGWIEFWNVNEPLATDEIDILIMEQRDIRIISILPVISTSILEADSLRITVGFAGKLDSIKFFYNIDEEWNLWATKSGNSEEDYNEIIYSLPIFGLQYSMTAVKIESHPDTSNWIKKLRILDASSMIKDRRICNSISAGIQKSGWSVDLGCKWSPCAGFYKGSTTLTTIVNKDNFYYQETVSQFFVPSCQDGVPTGADGSPPAGAGTVDGVFPFTKDGWTYSLEYYPVIHPLQSQAARIMGTYDGVTYELINNLPTYSFDGTSWAKRSVNQIFTKYNYAPHEGQKYFEVLLRSPFPVVYAFNLLEPLDLNVYSDEENVDLSEYPVKENMRTYFRGIHPKIRKF
jgi:hypothetical protein